MAVVAPAGSVAEARSTSDLPFTTWGDPLVGDRKPNWYVMGRSESVQPAAVKTKASESSTPVDGSTPKEPGRGGPLVVTTMAAADVPQLSLNSRVDRTGRALAPSTRLRTLAELSGITELTGDREDVARFTAADASTLHSAVQVDCTVTEPVRVIFWLVLTEVKLCAVEVICTTGAIALNTVGSGVGTVDGAIVGTAEGLTVGIAVGRAVGTSVGASVGTAVGEAEGTAEGFTVGTALGFAEGVTEGAADGYWVGEAVGVAEGLTLG